MYVYKYIRKKKKEINNETNKKIFINFNDELNFINRWKKKILLK